jgi:hypothetical protein
MSKMRMTVEEHKELIRQALHPDPSQTQKLLEQLGLAENPSKEEVLQRIEDRILSVPDAVPLEWLPDFQMYDISCFRHSLCNVWTQ